MKKSIHILILVLLFSAGIRIAAYEQSAQPKPPVAEKIPKITTVHGDTLTDNYFWLREKTNPKVMDYLKAEDTYAQTMMQPTTALQEKLYNEMLSHIKQTDVNVPYLHDGYYYYSRTQE